MELWASWSLMGLICASWKQLTSNVVLVFGVGPWLFLTLRTKFQSLVLPLALKVQFLPRDAMLALCMLWLCVCLSVPVTSRFSTNDQFIHFAAHTIFLERT